MTRYRVFAFDFDTRARLLEPIREEWEDEIKQQHRNSQAQILQSLQDEYGTRQFEQKLQNFRDIGAKPFSILAFHNRFYAQARSAFVSCQYYPALTAVCALGERVLNHLVIGLRHEYKSSSIYKRVYRKSSFDDWTLAIDALAEWGVLTETSEAEFRTLARQRNAALHFNPETDTNDRALALEALLTFGRIVESQFACLGQLPWLFMPPGEVYIRQDWEDNPFVRLVYLPNCIYVGYKHEVTSVIPWKVSDAHEYESREVTDEEFATLRIGQAGAG